MRNKTNISLRSFFKTETQSQYINVIYKHGNKIRHFNINLFCLISLTRRVHFMPLYARHLTNIGHDILMRQADSFGQTSSAAGVRQECQVVDPYVARTPSRLIHTISDHLCVASDPRWHGWWRGDVHHHHSPHLPALDRLLYLADG